MQRPANLPEWDTTEVNSIEPDATHKSQGWLAPGGVPEKPPFQTFNHWMNEVYKWAGFIDSMAKNIKFLDEYSGSLPDAVADIGSAETTLIISTIPNTITTNLTIPSTLSIKQLIGCEISDGGGTANLTFNGSFEAKRYAVFNWTGSGAIIFGSPINEVLPEWWGDDTAALQAAIDTNKPVDFLPGKTYVTTSTITSYGNITIKTTFGDPAIIAPATDFRPFVFSGNTGSKLVTSASAEMEVGDDTVTLASVTGITIGDLMTFSSNVLWYWDNRGTLYKGELHTVKSISGNVVTLTSPICDNYDISGTEVVTVTVYAEANCHIDNIKIKGSVGDSNGLISLNYYQNSTINNLQLENNDTSGVSLNNCFNTVFDKTAINLACDMSVTTTGYGIQDNGGAFTKIISSNFVGCRRGVDFSGNHPARFGEVSNCSALHANQFSPGETSGFGTHGTAEYILFVNNVISGCRTGIYSRGGNISIISNKFFGKGQQAVLSTHGNNLYIANNALGSPSNRVELTQDLAHLSYKEFLNIGGDFDAFGNVTVVNNKSYQTREAFITSAQTDITWDVRNNSANILNNASGNDVFFLAGESDLSKSCILDNKYSVQVGTKNWFHANTTISPQLTDISHWEEMTISKLVVWSGTGTLANVTVDLLYTLQGDKVHIRGEIKFDVITSTVKLRLEEVPESVAGNGAKFISQDESYNLITLQFISDDLYISSDNSGHDTNWAIGTGYIVPINIMYNR